MKSIFHQMQIKPHISSIEYSSKRHWGLLALGIILLIGGVSIALASGEAISLSLAGIGFILIFLAAILKSESVEVSVIGLKDPRKWKGSRDELDALLQIVRQKRTTKHVAPRETPPETPPETRPETPPTETKDIDSIDKIRRLAKLKDDGIITQEEFEQKKSELLRDLH